MHTNVSTYALAVALWAVSLPGCAVTHSTVHESASAAPLALPSHPQLDKSADVIVERTIDIDAPPPLVFAILCDVDSWTRWDKNVTEARTRDHRPLEEGDQFFQNPGGYATEAQVLDVIRGQALRWKGHQPGGGGVTGVHSFQTIALPGGRTRVINREEFSRWYLRLIGWATDFGIGKQFQRTLENLKLQAETAQAQLATTGLESRADTVVVGHP